MTYASPSRAYYNEIDPHAAQWLRNLIAEGHLPAGDVDTRDIRDVSPSNLDGYTQCHFFAGVGIWPLALRQAGVSDAERVWTGSCPCQPFSAAGAGAGMDDERHLWPSWHWLVQQCRPETIFGEQVASKDGLGWADLVAADLEASDYACGFVDTCAAGFAAFHIRQRLYFAAHDLRSASGGLVYSQCAGPQGYGWYGDNRSEPGRVREIESRSVANTGTSGGMGDAQRDLSDGRPAKASGSQGEGRGLQEPKTDRLVDASGRLGGLADAAPAGCNQRGGLYAKGTGCRRSGHGIGSEAGWTSPPDDQWPAADWLYCRDGSWRAVEPGTFPLAHENTARMGRLRAYGNGLDAGQATAFIRAYLERDMVDLIQTPAGDLFEWGTGA